MTLIKSISGIRGTIGSKVGDDLTPLDIVKFTASYAKFINENSNLNNKIIIGRDARISGEMVSSIVKGTLIASGFDVIDLGLSTTPTVEMAVKLENADGGIIITASHNPKQWNALKLLNSDGEFISSEEGIKVLNYAENNQFNFVSVSDLGSCFYNNDYNSIHIDKVLDLPLVNVNEVKKANLKVVVDAVNSTGGILVPMLLQKMGVNCIKLYCEPNGDFPHNPEPLSENLQDISSLVVKEKADLGIVVDPDVDRLAFICEDGSMFGEEYTLVSVADYILSKNPGNTVSNLSSTSALAEVTSKYSCSYSASAVGEVNVVKKMKEVNAVIGGEGNGGVIYPELHYGRDAIVGIALFLTQLVESKLSVSNLRDRYPKFYMLKRKIQLSEKINIEDIFNFLHSHYEKENKINIDGLKIHFDNGWVHLRRSNTEPIIRIYVEGRTQKDANCIFENVNELIKAFI